MDTLSHALIGLAVAGLSGHPLSPTDPVYLAAIIGAEAPDFDIIAQVRGNMAYLKQHRSFSHSIPGVALWACAISLGIHFFLPQAPLINTFLWALAGGLSHTVIDYFNTHGTAILWPFRKERKSYPLLNVFDPVLFVLLMSLFAFPLTMLEYSLATFTTLIIYIGLRYLLRKRAIDVLLNRFYCKAPERIWVMPSLKRLLFWDFVVETKDRHLNGQLGAIYPVMEIRANLPRQARSPLAMEAEKTSLGEFFRTFTPFCYFEEAPSDTAQVNIYDLRYYDNMRFIHSATIVFDQDNIPCESYMHSLGRTVKVNGY